MSFFISVEWKITAAERETKQVLSALHQKLRLKINNATYGGVAWVLVAPGLPQPKL